MSAAMVERSTVPAALPAAQNDLYRLLLLRQNGSELLVAGERPSFTLPCVEIPRWERVAENMDAVVKKRYAISGICLFMPGLGSGTECEQPLYQVIEARDGTVVPPDGTCWVPVDLLSGHSFADEQDSAAFGDTMREVRDFQSGAAKGPFGRPGWIDELFSWAQHELDPYGLRLNGGFRQLNASPTFALLRLETNGPAVWFKAVGEPNLREFPISVTLSRLFPGFVPTVIATHPAWNGWLTTEFRGSMLDELQDASTWERAAQTLAELQVEAIRKGDRLLGAGCRDLRVPSLLTMVDPFADVMSELMEKQQKAAPPALSGPEVRTLARQVKDSLSDLAELDIPDTLGHLDFNPGNILCSADQCIFLDWAEGYVGPPFLTFEYLRAHLERLGRENASLAADVASAYETSWRRVLCPEAVSAGFDLAPVLAVFAYVVGTETWRDPALLSDPKAAAYLRSLTRRMHSEMHRLQDRRQLCCK